MQATLEHPFASGRGWVAAQHLVVGDTVRRSDGTYVAITAVEVQTELAVPVSVYNIEVAEWHTYLVGKWLWVVHNAKVCVKEVVDAAKNAIRKRPKVPAEAVRDAAGNLTEYGKWYYERPFKFRSGVKDKVWDAAKDARGRVHDPVSGSRMKPNDPWDMGHKPGYEFRKHQQSAAEREIGRKRFLDEHNTPGHYRPETPSSNRSHAGEDISRDYHGF